MKATARRTLSLSLVLAVSALLPSCATVDPKKMEVPIEQTAPREKITSFTENLKTFGLMMEIYKTSPSKVMVKEITDKTGASISTGSEIQHNITEIVKSTLNSMGENVIFIEYDPEFVQAMQVTGYTDFSNKLVPEVVVTGAITEFDRALESWEKGMDVGAEVEFSHLNKALPSQVVSADYATGAMASKARVTVDFNLKDFATLAGLPGMSVVNSMEVQKGQAKKEYGVTLFGPTFGSNGSKKVVQGRHDAVRLLTQSGMIQLVGRRAAIPYWRIFGEDAVPDEIVLKSWKREFPRLEDSVRIQLLQQYLFLHGYDLDVSGVLDEATKSAYAEMMTKLNLTGTLNSENFLKIYLSVPINENTFERRQMMIARMARAAGNQQGSEAPAATAPQDDLAKAGNLMSKGYGLFKQGNYQGSADFFEQSLMVAPTPVAHYYLALCYQSLNDKQKAAAQLELGVQQFKDDFPLWKALGMCYYEIGQEQKAKTAFSSALNLRPNDKQVRFLIDRIN